MKTLEGISLAGLLPERTEASAEKSPFPAGRKSMETDVLVIGGGTAGVIAAIQAARAGCSTLLLENGSQLGGTISTGGVSFPGLFHAWGKQIIRGIGWELVSDTVALDDGILPDFSLPTGRRHWKHQIRINGCLFALLAEEKCLQAGVRLRYYETPVEILLRRNRWEVETVGKGCRVKIVCRQLIDCTGNAAACILAGLPVLREEETQPGTLMFRLGGYDVDSLDFPAMEKRYDEELKKGKLSREEFRNVEGLLRSAGNNFQHIAGADSTTSETHTRANIRGRTSLMNMLRFLRELPGCEKIRLLQMQPETGVRETYRIDGEYRISREDYVSGRIFDDSIAYSFYPIDLHDRLGVDPKHLPEGTVATIPLRALIPRKSRNLLVAGRAVSSDRLANSALRVQASCMAMGQAAGAAAALACRLHTSPLKVPMQDLRRLILEHDGILPPIPIE